MDKDVCTQTNIKCKTGEIAADYFAYLQTKHWKALRQLVYERSKGVCRKCKSKLNGSFDVHHKTYLRIGHERLTDLVCLCHACHVEAHRIIQAERTAKAKEEAGFRCKACGARLNRIGNFLFCTKCDFFIAKSRFIKPKSKPKPKPAPVRATVTKTKAKPQLVAVRKVNNGE